MDQIQEWDIKENKLMVIDDLMNEKAGQRIDQDLSDLFTKGSHHMNINIIFTTQNLFPQSKSLNRDISLNSTGIVLFKNNRDINPIRIVGRQVCGVGKDGDNFFSAIFRDLDKIQYGYLYVDCSVNMDNCTRFRCHLFPNEENSFYIKKEHVEKCKKKLIKAEVTVVNVEQLNK